MASRKLPPNARIVRVPARGHYVTFAVAGSGACHDGFICQVAYEGDCPEGALKVTKNYCVIGYSRACTHMGCHLLAAAPGPQDDDPCAERLRLAASGYEPSRQPSNGASRRVDTSIDRYLRCPCHFSCFDLLAKGAVIMGPATDWLPQLALKPGRTVRGRLDQVVLDPENLWRRTTSVPYGVPYGKTIPPNDGWA